MFIGCVYRSLRNRRSTRTVATVATILALFASLGGVAAQAPAGPPRVASGPPPAPSANVSVFATGVESPRGFRFGPDGSFYVAEAGMAGTTSTVGQCDQVLPPSAPILAAKLPASRRLTRAARSRPSCRASRPRAMRWATQRG